MSSMHALLSLSLARLEQPRHALAVAPVDLALHQQRQAVLEGQRLGGGLGGRVVERGDHTVQAQAAQLVQGVLVEHGRSVGAVGCRGVRYAAHQWCP
jgi:hypothetical protein